MTTNADMENTARQLQGFSSRFQAIEAEIHKVMVGQEDVVRNVLAAMVAGGNVLLEGLPGLGKTKLVKSIGAVLDLPFARIQFTPDLMPADITGTDIYLRNPDGTGGFAFQKGPLFANIILADEINRATPKTQSALLEAMQERTVTVGKQTYILPKPFFVLATQNPLEMEGTYPLPEAQMDRFIIKLNVPFPSKEELLRIVSLTTGIETVTPAKVCDGPALEAMGEAARMIPVSQPVADYAMSLILKTHPESPQAAEDAKRYIRYGASPRGAQALVTIARIYALLAGRFNVAFDDIRAAAYPVLRHRLFLNFEAVAEGVTPDDIIARLLADNG